MAFSRSRSAAERPQESPLTARMAGIGLNFAASGDFGADIEETLVDASALGMDGGDLRVLSVLTTWMGVHHDRLNADRLTRLVVVHPSARVRAYWSAVAIWLSKDRRLARMASTAVIPRVDVLGVGTEFLVERKGEDSRFVGTALRVPAGSLRDRPADVSSPEWLTRMHAGYRNRVLMGPSFRADIWTILQTSAALSVADVARRARCSFSTAWQVSRDYELLRRAEETCDA